MQYRADERPIALVIPCYNEAKRLDSGPFVKALKENENLTLIFVNDGSQDGTLVILHQFKMYASGRVRVIDRPENMGKAEAIRHGVLSTRDDDFSWLGYWDAGLATPLAALNDFFSEDVPDRLKAIIGSRVKLCGWDIQRKGARHVLGRTACFLVDTLFKLGVYDTQCGAKVFEAKTLLETCQEPFITQRVFDIELLLRLVDRFGPCDLWLREIPLKSWKDKETSRLRLFAAFKSWSELWQLRKTIREKAKSLENGES